jgi:hypothetical protein
MWANLAIYIGDLKKYKIVYLDEKPIMYQGCIITTTFSHGYMSHLIGFLVTSKRKYVPFN